VGEKTNKLTICLIKPEYTEPDQIIKDGVLAHPIEGLGTFYCEPSHPAPPGWIKDFFGTALDGKFSLIASSAKGLLLLNIERDGKSHIFAVIFGHGRFLVRDGVAEERFGLKVVLNTVIEDSLRSIDKTTLGSVPKQSREQISRASAATTFGIDIEQDLLGSVTGASKDKRFGRTITGRDSLSVSTKIDMTEIQEFALLCLERYEAQDYLENFDWVDQIKDVRDRKAVDALDALLVQRLADEELDKIWMAPPDILDWVSKRAKRNVIL